MCNDAFKKLFCLPTQLISLESVGLTELCMLIVTISYCHNIVILTITIIIKIDYHDN